MKISKKGIDLIKSFEGLRLSAYKDIAGVWTIGYGSTRYHDGKAVKPGDKLASEEQASALLANTMGEYENAVNGAVKVPLTQNQFDALVSFTYNVGTGGFRQSTLLKKLNSGDYTGASLWFAPWNKITDPATGKKVVSKTLASRREQERKLFITA